MRSLKFIVGDTDEKPATVAPGEKAAVGGFVWLASGSPEFYMLDGVSKVLVARRHASCCSSPPSQVISSVSPLQHGEDRTDRSCQSSDPGKPDPQVALDGLIRGLSSEVRIELLAIHEHGGRTVDVGATSPMAEVKELTNSFG